MQGVGWFPRHHCRLLHKDIRHNHHRLSSTASCTPVDPIPPEEPVPPGVPMLPVPRPDPIPLLPGTVGLPPLEPGVFPGPPGRGFDMLGPSCPCPIDPCDPAPGLVMDPPEPAPDPPRLPDPLEGEPLLTWAWMVPPVNMKMPLASTMHAPMYLLFISSSLSALRF